MVFICSKNPPNPPLRKGGKGGFLGWIFKRHSPAIGSQFLKVVEYNHNRMGRIYGKENGKSRKIPSLAHPPEGKRGKVFKTCPPSLFESYFCPQTDLVARKQGHSGQKASAGKEFCPENPPGFRRTGRAARAPGRAPLHRNPPVLWTRTACPPCTILGTGPARSKKGGAPHGFCAGCPCFRAWHGLKFNILYACSVKSEGGQGFQKD
jgi:hypothetical protein